MTFLYEVYRLIPENIKTKSLLKTNYNKMRVSLGSCVSTRLLNSISSRICRQNTQFNMYTTTPKQQEGCTFKDSHPKCFITTNFDKFHREAFARALNRGDVFEHVSVIYKQCDQMW